MWFMNYNDAEVLQRKNYSRLELNHIRCDELVD